MKLEPLLYPVSLEYVEACNAMMTPEAMGLDVKFFELLNKSRDPHPTATEHRIRWNDFCAGLRKRYGP